MAITLFCYVTEDQQKAQEKILRLRAEHSELLDAGYLLSDAKEVSAIERRIASEYGIGAVSLFLMRLNRKDRADKMEEAEDLVKAAFGKEKVLILWENELKH